MTRMKMKIMEKKRYNNRYKFWYDTPYDKEYIKNLFGEGWQELIENAFRVVSYFPNAQICSAKRFYGMLHMYATADDEFNLHVIEGILWKVERLSAKICEHCGKQGRRRKELKETRCLCNNCYLEFLNKADDPRTLFMEGREGRFKED